MPLNLLSTDGGRGISGGDSRRSKRGSLAQQGQPPLSSGALLDDEALAAAASPSCTPEPIAAGSNTPIFIEAMMIVIRGGACE